MAARASNVGKALPGYTGGLARSPANLVSRTVPSRRLPQSEIPPSTLITWPVMLAFFASMR